MKMPGGSDAATFVRSAAEIAAWVQGAADGDEYVYARADALPVAAKGPIEARKLRDAGIVSLGLARREGRLNYLMRKRVLAAIAGRETPVPIKKLMGVDARLYRMLRDLAAAKLGDPGNAALMRELGLKSPQALSYRLHRLVALNKISVEFDRVARVRKITILSTKQILQGGAA